MELVISGGFAEKILTLLKRDKGLANSLAAEWLERVDVPMMAAYLLTPKVAGELLAARLVADPQGTMADLQALAAGDAVTAPASAKSAKPAKAAKPVKPVKPAKPGKAAKKSKEKATKKAAKQAAKVKAAKAPKAAPVAKPAMTKAKPAKKTAGPRRRKRLSSEQIATLKDVVLGYLGTTAAANRRQIIAAAEIPTTALYNRILGELREEGSVGSEGLKAKAVYFLAKGKAARAATAAKNKTGKGKR